MATLCVGPYSAAVVVADRSLALDNNGYGCQSSPPESQSRRRRFGACFIQRRGEMGRSFVTTGRMVMMRSIGYK